MKHSTPATLDHVKRCVVLCVLGGGGGPTTTPPPTIPQTHTPNTHDTHTPQVVEERVADDDIIVLKGCTTTRAVTLLLRGPNDYMLDEMDRSMHDAFCIVKRVLESGQVVPGGGAVEAALSMHLEQYAKSLGSREQLAIAEFADALLVIPKTLAVNAAKVGGCVFGGGGLIWGVVCCLVWGVVCCMVCWCSTIVVYY